MSGKRPSGPTVVMMGLQAAVAVAVAIWLVVKAGSLAARLQTIAFYLGGGGVLLMFFRWRRHGDRVAQVLCLAAFSTWGVSVAVASGSDGGVTPTNPGYWVAGLALFIGFGGGLATLLRMYLGWRKRKAFPPESSSSTS